MTLDDRIYSLQRTPLPADLSDLLRKADKIFLQDKDSDAEILISEIEHHCKNRVITIYNE